MVFADGFCVCDSPCYDRPQPGEITLHQVVPDCHRVLWLLLRSPSSQSQSTNLSHFLLSIHCILPKPYPKLTQVLPRLHPSGIKASACPLPRNRCFGVTELGSWGHGGSDAHCGVHPKTCLWLGVLVAQKKGPLRFWAGMPFKGVGIDGETMCLFDYSRWSDSMSCLLAIVFTAKMTAINVDGVEEGDVMT